jgi:hypothetical protein
MGDSSSRAVLDSARGNLITHRQRPGVKNYQNIQLKLMMLQLRNFR